MAKMENDAEEGGPGGRPRGKSGGGFAEDLIAIEERRRSAEADAGGWSAAGRASDRELTEKQEECTTSGAYCPLARQQARGGASVALLPQSARWIAVGRNPFAVRR